MMRTKTKGERFFQNLGCYELCMCAVAQPALHSTHKNLTENLTCNVGRYAMLPHVTDISALISAVYTRRVGSMRVRLMEDSPNAVLTSLKRRWDVRVCSIAAAERLLFMKMPR